MIRSTGISINRPWSIFHRRRHETVAEPRDEVAEAEARRQREALFVAHQEAVRTAVIFGGGWYF